MPPRRRNKANSARSAAIRAVRKRQGEETVQNTFLNNCRFPNPKMNQCIPIPDKKVLGRNDDEDDDDDDDVPDLLDHNDDRITDGDYDSRGEDYISEDEEDDDVEEDDEDEDDEGCLHCQSMSNDIQVHCDECQAYVCEECHWCHEYQANHEIRVCDRCDAFYCRGCDEMDQCEDCGEVVCASCSTLLSCKFCGGGLCEECATACGRCGIVLCSRDAKFAVECDTCRLSYCLVCLASGSKDPCVRCGHRPSKRMEQLVHLRLKSIYKAFKQSSSNPSGKMGPHAGGHGGRNTTTIEELEDYDTEEFEPDPSILMAAKAASGHMSDPTTSALHYAAREMDLEHALVENYIQEKQKADAAAEALLAELEEEEEAAKSKKSKKKRKKERQLAAKREEEEKKRQEEEEKMKKAAEPVKKHQQKQEGKARMKDASMKSATPSTEAASLPSKQPAQLGAQFDEIEVKLCQLIEDGDCEGIEEVLFALKGVPGRAALRKNAKKALKRIRTVKDTTAGATKEVIKETTPNKLPSNTTESIPSKGMNGTASVPPSIPTTTNTGTRLKAVSGGGSSTHHASSKSNHRDEYVMQMSSTLVGWVIGKGGQRIRDMMEESGAKIWIDQEKAKAADCRNVYVSGERKCVEKAVKMVQELLSKAPTGHQHQQQSEHVPRESRPVEIPTQKQPVPEQPLKSPGVGKAGNVGMVTTVPQQQTEQRTLASEPVRLAEMTAPAVNSVEHPTIHLPEPTTTHDPSEIMDQKPAFQQILTCEACFVPLLIGKRGWTIKSIQDESGARVDIDQAVTPRQIKVSGSKANVDVAIRMVRDVLSYPHAQLQQPADEQGSPPHLPPDANALLSASSSHSVTPPERAMRPAQPPYSMPPSGQMIPPVRQQMPGAPPVHPGLSAGPPFLMGPPPSITGIGMPPQPLQPPPPFYGQRDGIVGQVPGDFMMGGMRAGPPTAGLQPNPVPMAPSQPSQQQQQQQQQFPQYTPMDAAAAASTRPASAPQSQGLWNPSSASYMNGDGLNGGQSAPTAASQSLFGPEASLPVRQQDSDLIDSLFGPADKSKADDAQIDALFGLNSLSIDDNATSGELGLWGPSPLTEWASGGGGGEQGEAESKDPPPPSALPGLTESFLQRGGTALQHPPESRFDWSSMG